MPVIYDHHGNEIKSPEAPVHGRAIVSVRERYLGYPSQGLTPQGLAHILREADSGDMLRQAELFEEIEEKGGHLASVLQTRRLAISGLEWKFAPFSSDETDKRIADEFTAMWEDLDTSGLLTDMMDAVSKGVSFTALKWRSVNGRFVVVGHEYVHQKHWRYDIDGKRFRLITDEYPMGYLPQFGQVVEHIHRAKSGSPTRAGVMRTCVWMHLFLSFAIKDWVTFSEVYGMPVRIGKYDPSTGKDEREALELAVAMIGSDAAGIISKDTEIELLEAAKASSVDVYQKLIDLCEATQSKAVLGQTLTSGEGQHGTQALGNVHEEVRQDLKKADARAVSKSLRMQLIRPWIVFNYGAEYADRAPKPVPQISDPEDLVAASTVVKTLREAGLRIPITWVQEKFGIPAPQDDEAFLEESVDSKLYEYHLRYGVPTVNEVRGRLGLEPIKGGDVATAEPATAQPNSAQPKTGALAALGAGESVPGRASLLTGTLFADALAESGREGVASEALAKVGQVEAAVRSAGSLEEAKAALAALYGDLPRSDMLRVLEAALTLAELAGVYSAQEGA